MPNNPSSGKEESKLGEEGLRPGYVRPEIITYSSEQLLEEIGPVSACSPAPCAVGG